MSILFKHIQPLIKKIIKLSKTRKNLARLRTFLVFVSAAFIVIMISYYPLITEINERKDELDYVESMLRYAKKSAKRLPEYRKRIAEAQADFSAKALPETANIHSLLQSISLCAKDSGLELLLFEQGVETKKEYISYADIPVSIHTKGGFGNIRMFLDKIANMDRIVRVRDIHMTYSKDEESVVNLSCTAIVGRFTESPAGENRGKPKRRNSEQQSERQSSFQFFLFISVGVIIGILALLSFKIHTLDKEIKYTKKLIDRNKKNACRESM
ncbi:MAG: type 4a pilus biogenesis protein PilO [Desulfobacterales bacterium]|nr:type 4a pilus biogenesis protein PilO [Desulfobacterales bacterium]